MNITYVSHKGMISLSQLQMKQAALQLQIVCSEARRILCYLIIKRRVSTFLTLSCGTII